MTIKVITRTNNGVQCYCGTILKVVKKWDYYIAYKCPGCYISMYCNFDPDKNYIFKDCEQVIMIDKN